MIEVSEEESEGEDEEECVTDTLQAMQVKLEKDKQSILQNTEILSEVIQTFTTYISVYYILMDFLGTRKIS